MPETFGDFLFESNTKLPKLLFIIVVLNGNGNAIDLQGLRKKGKKLVTRQVALMMSPLLASHFNILCICRCKPI